MGKFDSPTGDLDSSPLHVARYAPLQGYANAALCPPGGVLVEMSFDVISRGVGWLAGFALAGSFVEKEISPLYHTGECPADAVMRGDFVTRGWMCVLPVNANIHLQYKGAGALTDVIVTIDVYPKNITTATEKLTGLVHILLSTPHFTPMPWCFVSVRLSSVASADPQSAENNRASDRARRLYYGTD
jgi:hypothetical protein